MAANESTRSVSRAKRLPNRRAVFLSRDRPLIRPLPAETRARTATTTPVNLPPYSPDLTASLFYRQICAYVSQYWVPTRCILLVVVCWCVLRDCNTVLRLAGVCYVTIKLCSDWLSLDTEYCTILYIIQYIFLQNVVFLVLSMQF